MRHARWVLVALGTIAILLAVPLALDTGPPLVQDIAILANTTEISVDSNTVAMVVDTNAGTPVGTVVTSLADNPYINISDASVHSSTPMPYAGLNAGAANATFDLNLTTAMGATDTSATTSTEAVTERNTKLRHHAGKIHDVFVASQIQLDKKGQRINSLVIACTSPGGSWGNSIA